MSFFKNLTRKPLGYVVGIIMDPKVDGKVTIEGDKVICYTNGVKDVLLSKETVESFTLKATDISVSDFMRLGPSCSVSEYEVKMKDGSFGTIRVLKGDGKKMETLINK